MTKDKKLFIWIVVLLGGYISTMARGLEIYGHRGMAWHYPENTLYGYEKAIELGVDSLDIDVAITKDNIVVGAHDPFLNRDLTRDSNGQWLKNNDILIKNLSFNELQKYDVGKIDPDSSYYLNFSEQQGRDNLRIPSLDQVIKLIKTSGNKNLKIQIEIKTNPKHDNQEFIENFVDNIIDVLNKNDFIDKAELQSFDWRTLIYAKKISPNIKSSFMSEQSLTFDTFSDNILFDNTDWTAGYKLENYDGSIIKMMATLGANNWCPLYKNVTPELVKEAHLHNIRVIPWTADTTEDMLYLINAGVDGIITNKPDLLRDVMTELNIELPKSYT